MAGNGTIIPLGKITQPQTKHPKRWLATSGGLKEGQSSAVATDVQGSILTSQMHGVHFGMASRLDQSLRQSLFNQTHKKFTSMSPTMPIFFFFFFQFAVCSRSKEPAGESVKRSTCTYLVFLENARES